MRHKFTDENKKKARELFDDDYSGSEISRAVRVDTRTLYAFLARQGLRFRDRESVSRGSLKPRKKLDADMSIIPCLKCRIDFKSANVKSNRICGKCTIENQGYAGVVYE